MSTCCSTLVSWKNLKVRGTLFYSLCMTLDKLLLFPSISSVKQIFIQPWMDAKFSAKMSLRNKEKSKRHSPLHLRVLQFSKIFHLPNRRDNHCTTHLSDMLWERKSSTGECLAKLKSGTSMQNCIIASHKAISSIEMVKEYLTERSREGINVYRASAPDKEIYIYYFIHTLNWLGGYELILLTNMEIETHIS